MNRPELIPNPDGTWNLDYPLNTFRMPSANDPIKIEAATRAALKKCPWDFGAAMALSDLLTEQGDVQQGCQIRFDSLQRAIQLLDSDEEIVINWNDSQARNMVELMAQSAVDHFWIQDFEICAAACEVTLDTDPEDHTGITPYLLYSYALLEDWDSFDERLIDLDPRSIHCELLESIRDFDRGVKTEVRIDPQTRQLIDPVCQQIPEWSELLKEKK